MTMPDHRTAPLAVSVNEAARLLGVSRATIYRLVRKEKLRLLKVGTRSLVSMDCLRKFLESSNTR